MATLLLTSLLALQHVGALPSPSLRNRETATEPNSVVQGAIQPSKQTLWDPTTGPTYRDVAQGTSGDCWLDASMAAIAYADQAHLKGMMVDPQNSDGTVPVTLYSGATAQSYTITKVTIDTMKATYSDAAPYVTSGNWVWPAAMENAFAAYAAANTGSGIPGDLDGGNGNEAFGAIYGSAVPISYLGIGDSDDDALWTVWNGVSNKPTVTASMSASSADLPTIGLPENHMYTAIGCDEAAGMVKLRNPWGIVSQASNGFSNNGGQGVTGEGDGVFEISFADWKTYFVDITQANPSGLPHRLI